MQDRKIIPLVAAEDDRLTGCTEAAPIALMVLGDSMEPEFHEGEVVVIEPEGVARDGAFVLAVHEEEYILRQLRRSGEGWTLHALNPAYPDAPIPGMSAVKGVVIQKQKPGSRRSRKSYVE